MKRRVDYRWRLREIMAARGLTSMSDLIPLLNDRGIDLSDSQIYRLLGQRPDRISLRLLGALCDALECTTEDLCQFHVVGVSHRAAAGDGGSLPRTIRPKRARLHGIDE